jgi:hypothetical protein
LHLVASLSKKRIFAETREYEGLVIEIQIRSLLQHTWAEIEHAYYKGEFSLPTSLKRRVSLLSGQLELADNEFVAVRTEALKLNMELPVCRGEGVSELVPDFSFDVPYSALPAASELSGNAILLWINTYITNRLLKDGMTEVELHVEGDTRSDLRRGMLHAAGILAFPTVFPLPPPSRRTSIHIRVSGLRVNALALALGSGASIASITGLLAVEKLGESMPAPLTGTKDIARIVPAMRFMVALLNQPTAPLPVRLSKSTESKKLAFRVAYISSFPDAFRPADKERSPTEISTMVQGTRLMLHFGSVPEGSRIFVTGHDLPYFRESSSFQLIKGDATGDGPFNPVSISSKHPIGNFDAEFAEIDLSQMTGFAIWECIGAVHSNEISFGIIFELPPQSGTNAITVTGNLAPFSTEKGASSEAPSPRFAAVHSPIKVVEFHQWE